MLTWLPVSSLYCTSSNVWTIHHECERVEEDITKILACNTHLGATNADYSSTDTMFCSLFFHWRTFFSSSRRMMPIWFWRKVRNVYSLLVDHSRKRLFHPINQSINHISISNRVLELLFPRLWCHLWTMMCLWYIDDGLSSFICQNQNEASSLQKYFASLNWDITSSLDGSLNA